MKESRTKTHHREVEMTVPFSTWPASAKRTDVKSLSIPGKILIAPFCRFAAASPASSVSVWQAQGRSPNACGETPTVPAWISNSVRGPGRTGADGVSATAPWLRAYGSRERWFAGCVASVRSCGSPAASMNECSSRERIGGAPTPTRFPHGLDLNAFGSSTRTTG